MTTPITGAISLGNVRTELGGAGAFSFASTNVRALANAPTGPVSLGDLRAATYIGTNQTNVSLFSKAGSPATSTTYKFLIPSGVTIGGSGAAAVTVGQFATSSSVILNNYGALQGYGGAANSGAGGDAINANYPNQTVVINNQSGATIYGGGGGGGVGGTGGTGGSGYGTGTVIQGASGASYSSCNDACFYTFGSGSYCVSGCSYTFYYQCSSCGTTSVVVQYGGAGGAGGAGGRGQGYGQAAASGSAGAAGSAGTGPLAGYGGQGGTGGTGGSFGNSGGTGNTGATGASGNYGSGSGGSAGAAGGAAGRYLVKGAYSVTLNNSGTVLGGLA